METIYAELIKQGHTDADIRGAVEQLNTRTFGLSVVDTPDGVPIVGVTYMCDFRAEEEWGVSSMAKAFEGQSDQAHRVRVTEDGMFLFNSGFGESSIQVEKARSYWNQNLSYAMGMEKKEMWNWKIKDMRVYANSKGINLKGKTKKADIEEAIQEDHRNNQKPEHPNRFPGWFHYGDVLALKATDGIVKDVLNLLVDAARENLLAVSNGRGAFSTGFGFYRTADIGPKLREELDEAQRQYEEDMAALAPVAAELKSRGFGWYFLGKPTPMHGTTKYWLNGEGRMGGKCEGQPYGWYSLEELLAEKFIADRKIKDAQKKFQYTTDGNSRKDVIYKNGNVDYRAMAERDGTSLEGLGLDDE